MQNDNHPTISKNQTRRLILIAVTALLAGISVSYLFTKPAQHTAPRSAQAHINATLYPVDFRTISEFTLQGTDGKPFTVEQFKNYWSLVFFGFTHCPDICPMTLNTLAQALESIPADIRTKTRVILVTVDPERDDIEKLKSYINYFNSDFLALRGEQDQLQILTKSFGVFYSKSGMGEDPSQYQVDHSAGIFLINPQGRMHALLSAPHDAKEIAKDFTTIIQHYKI